MTVSQTWTAELLYWITIAVQVYLMKWPASVYDFIHLKLGLQSNFSIFLPSIPCSILLEANFEAPGRMPSTFSGQKRSRKMRTIVTRKMASSKNGTMITSCSYTRISAKQGTRKCLLSLCESGWLEAADMFFCYSDVIVKNWKQLVLSGTGDLHQGSGPNLPKLTTHCISMLAVEVCLW